ncbi:uncharacterized protein LOC122391959 isoform X2 [Amphibalanus amphitrite]|uniref:uncharacterized protein LOC122391959 isoform X2 n=1 Tax=Amphibalanus amphitrite TaxID=1232801 RepID=UPI001C9165C5|nr:uncharacterized protein LOC122391959 isoform X2 [Amphibalanus amphitrite]
MASFGSIGPYEAGRAESWDEYCERLDQFFIANEVSDPAKQRAIFLSVVGGETYGKLRSLVAPQKPGEMPLKELLTHLQRHFEPRPSETVARFRFFTFCRAEGQSVQDYIAKLRKLSEHCNFGSFLSAMIRDRLICGVNSDAIQTRLLSESNLTLERAAEIAVALEAAGHDVQELRSGFRDREGGSIQVSTADVHRVDRAPRAAAEAGADRDRSTRRWGAGVRQVTGQRSAGDSRKPSKSSASVASGNDAKYRCWRCLSGQHLDRNCPFKLRRCFECSRLGHTRAAHRAGTVHVVEEDFEVEAAEPAAEQVGQVDEDVYDLFSCNSASKRPPIVITAELSGKPVQMELDTGASASLISEELYESMWPASDLPLQDCPQRFRTYTGEEIKIRGVAEVDVAVDGAPAVRLPLMVVHGKGPSLFGRNWLEKIRLNWNKLFDVSVPNHEYRRTMVPDEPPDSSALDSAAHAVAGESRDATVGGAEASETGALPSEKCADVGRHPSTSSPSPPSRFEAATASAPVPRRSARERRCPVRFRAGQSNPVGEECGDLM